MLPCWLIWTEQLNEKDPVFSPWWHNIFINSPYTSRANLFSYNLIIANVKRVYKNLQLLLRQGFLTFTWDPWAGFVPTDYGWLL